MAADDVALTPYVPSPPWSAEPRDALNTWAFGSLAPAPPLMWAQYPGLDPVLQVEVDHAEADEGEVSGLIVAEGDWGSDENGEVVAGPVISQTCDVVATGPGARHATVQVAPVVRVHTLSRN